MKSKIISASAAFGCASIMYFAAAAAVCAADAPASDSAGASGSALVESEIDTLFKEVPLKEVLERFSLEAGIGFESEYVFRGRSVTGPSINPSVNIGYDVGYGFALSAGYWGNYNVSDSSNPATENDFTFDITYTIENFTVDFGYTAYTYPSGGNTNELKVGVAYDTSELLGDFNVSPYVAGYYDLTLSGKTLEGGLSYSAPITKWLFGSTWGTLDFAGYVGYTYGDISFDAGGNSMNDSYFYAGFSAGGTVAVTDYCSLSAGMRYAYCNNYDPSGSTNSRVWFGTSLSFGF